MLNKIVRSTPFLLTPLFIFGQAKNLNSEEVKNKPSQNTSQASKLLDFSKDFFKLPKLTQEENKILDEMEDFLTKYTGNGKFNYGTIPRMIEGLKHDYEAVHQEALSMPRGLIRGMPRRAAMRYPDNRSGRVYGKIQGEIANQAYAGITHELSVFRVDPSTANEPDNAPITRFVNKRDLDRFTWNSYRLDDMSKKLLPENKKVIFPGGFSIEAAQFIRSRKIGIPPGGEIVDR